MGQYEIKIVHSKHSYSSTSVVKEFHTSLLIELSDNLGVGTPTLAPTAIKAWCVAQESDNKTVLSDQ